MPDWSSMLQEILIGRHLFESPLRYGRDMSLKPGVFVNWASGHAGSRWRFGIREGGVFRDGVPVDADSVVWNLKERFHRFVCPPTHIEAVQIEGSHQLVIHLSRPAPNLLHQLASFRASLVSPNFDAGAVLQPRAGSGPFELESVDDAVGIVLRRIESDKGRPGVPSRLVFVPLPHGEAMWEALISGDLEVIYEVPYRHVRDATVRQGFCIDRRESFSVSMLLFNGRRQPFDSADSRQGVAKALDPRELIEHAMEGVGVASTAAVLSPAHPLYPQRLDLYAPWLRTTASSATCARGGLSFRILAQSAYNPLWIDLMVRQLAEQGCECQVDRLPMSDLLKLLRRGEFDTALIGVAGAPDPDPVFRGLFHSNGLANYGGFADPRYDELIDRAAESDSGDARREYYRRAIEILHFKCPAVFLRHGLSVLAHPANVKGLVAYPDNLLRLEDVWIGKANA